MYFTNILFNFRNAVGVFENFNIAKPIVLQYINNIDVNGQSHTLGIFQNITV